MITIHKKRKRRVVTLNSHALDNYCRCPAAYGYADVMHIEPAKTYRPFLRGQVITNVLAEYYWRKLQKGKLNFSDIEECAGLIDDNEDLDEESKAVIFARFHSYALHYKDEHWIPLAVEKNKLVEHTENHGTGFSKILYESDYVVFIWEGEPDLIVRCSSRDKTVLVVDHKHESRFNDLYMYQNQFLGYAWGTESANCCINYFNIKSSGDASEWFRRRTVNYSRDKLQSWRKDTLFWFYKIMLARKNKEYMKSWQCEGKYGTCQFHPICEQTHDFIKADIIKRQYKKRERTRSW